MIKARVLQVIESVQRVLDLYGRLLKRFVYPVLNELGWAYWIIPCLSFGIVALLIGHIGGELVGGVALAIVLTLALLSGLEAVFDVWHWTRLAFMVWLMAAVCLTLLETPQTAMQMLTDPRIYIIMGGFVGGGVLLVLSYACLNLQDAGFNQWRNTRLRDRIAAEIGMPAADVDRVLAALDVEMDDSYPAPSWRSLATLDGYNQDDDRRRQRRRDRREARRAARKAKA